MTSNHILLYRLAELMLQNEQHVLPVDLLFDHNQIGDLVKSIQIDSPYQQMLLEGVLTESVRDEKLFVSFTVEGYFHFVLGEVIYNRTEGLGAEALKHIVEENKLNGAKEGVEQCLTRFSIENYIQYFKALTNIAGDISFLVTPTTNVIKSNNIAEFADYLVNNSNKKAIEILKKSIGNLRDMGNNDSVVKFLNDILNRIRGLVIKTEPEIIYLCDLALSYASYFSLKDLSDLIDLLFQYDFDKSDIEKVDFYSNIGFAFRLLNRRDDAFEFYQNALRENSGNFYKKVKILSRVATFHSELAIKNRCKVEGDLAIDGFKEIVVMIDNVHHFDPLLKATVCNNYSKVIFTFFMYQWELKFSVNEIEKMQKESHDIIVKNRGKYSDLSAKIINNQSLFFAMIGDLNKSLELCLRGFNVVQRIFPYFSNDTAIFSFNVGNRYEQLKKFKEAKHYYQMAFEINRQLGLIKQNNQMNTAFIRVLNELNELELAKNIEAQISQIDL